MTSTTMPISDPASHSTQTEKVGATDSRYKEDSGFEELNLKQELLDTLSRVGYESPSPIQKRTIPPLLAGEDLVGQAQTGTGKTAAFALPILQNLDLRQGHTQALVLTPTRELAIQVAEAFGKYGSLLENFRVAPMYGGQDFRPQLKLLKRGLHVVVGTPGRLMDHMRKGRLQLEGLKTVVLDEADEMLRMGFIDDVEWILEQLPPKKQIVLFSATMPDRIRNISKKYLKSPNEITIQRTTQSAGNVRERFWMVSGLHKLDALTRILEVEEFDGMILFVRTKAATLELAEKLSARGFLAAPLNGEIPQKKREETIRRLKNKKIDILVATDVAARGLDVERISHVINYDIPYDAESYIHRIGRTGRAGRKGEAIVFVAPRETRMLKAIERATRRNMELLRLPTVSRINDQRILKFKNKIVDILSQGAAEWDFYEELIAELSKEQNMPPTRIAAALARLLHGKKSFLLEGSDPAPYADKTARNARKRPAAKHTKTANKKVRKKQRASRKKRRNAKST